MTSTAQLPLSPQLSTKIALTWCLAWGQEPEPAFPREALQQMRHVLSQGNPSDISQDLQPFISQAEAIQKLSFPNKLTDLKESHSELWDQPANIGLVYGGATKIKGYVFESSKLSDIRGASAILDQINLIDLPAFFKKVAPPTDDSQTQSAKALAWLEDKHNFPGLTDALIPELIIYSTGGNILAFCPVAYVDDLANAIEKRYSEETLTANSCAVGRAYRPLEIKLGVLQPKIDKTPWFDDWYKTNATQPIVEAYYGPAKGKSEAALKEQFQQRKNFSEAVGYLTADFQKRRNGNDAAGSTRPSRRYPPKFETHPYLRRDGSEHRSVIGQASELPSEPWVSESQARKLHIGQVAKRDGLKQDWFAPFDRDLLSNSVWPSASRAEPKGSIKSWVVKFEEFLDFANNSQHDRYYESIDLENAEITETRDLDEIGQASAPGSGFVAYIYADGNNMGGYIQKHINSPDAYRQFSEDIFTATEYSCYLALAQHLRPAWIQRKPRTAKGKPAPALVHPFEIITIGGDDVLLIVPASAALEIAQTLGEQFEKILLKQTILPKPQKPEDRNLEIQRDYSGPPLDTTALSQIHRYRPESAPTERCILSTSSGVLITHIKTPIYYAEDLTNQLLKTAKHKAKALKPQGYSGGTVDFQVLKNVTMISSSITAFRKEGLTIERYSKGIRKKGQDPDQTLKLHGAPYTLYELQGLLKTIQAIKDSGYARSQLYQVRGLLEQGKRTAMLNYHYFRARLSSKRRNGERSQQELLIEEFEQAWCKAKNNGGTLSPWMFQKEKTYETIWRELVDLHPFVAKSLPNSPQTNQTETTTAQSKEG